MAAHSMTLLALSLLIDFVISRVHRWSTMWDQ